MSLEQSSLVEVFGQLSSQELSHLALLPSGEDAAGNPTSYNEHVLYRTFPAPHHCLPNPTPNEAERLIDDSQAHFEKLREFGIQVPTVIAGQTTPGAAETTISSVVDRVDGQPIGQYWNWPTLGDRAPFQRQALRLVRGLIRYYTWAISEESVFLSDISNPLQYRITGHQVTLIDTDPIMTSIFPIAGSRMLERLNDLRAFAGFIQSDDVIKLQDSIDNLRNEYRARAFNHIAQNTNTVTTLVHVVVQGQRLCD